MKFISIILLIAVAFNFAGCRSGGKPDSFIQVEKLMVESPDKALTVLQGITFAHFHTKPLKAKYALLYSEALDKNYIDVDNDSLIRFAVDYYKNHGKDIDKAKAYYYYGIVHNNAGDIDEAMESFVKARVFVEKTDDYYLNGLIYNVIGNLYYGQCSFDEALNMYSNAADAFLKAKSKKNWLFAIHSKGLTQVYLGQNQEAIESLTNGIKLATEQCDTTTLLDIISAIGGIQAKIKTDSTSLYTSKNYLFQTYRRYTRNTIPFEHYPIIGNIYFKENRIDSAKYYFTEYLKQKQEITESNLAIFTLLSAIESQSNHYKKALEYERLSSYYTDSINTAHKNILIQNLEKKYKAEYFQKSYIILQTKYKYETMTFILIFILIILIIGILVTYYRREVKVRNQQIIENQNYVEEVQQYYSELKEKYDKISKNIQDEKSQALFEILKNRIHSLQSVLELASKYENNTDAFYEKFKEYIKVTSDNNKRLSEDVIAIANLFCHGIIRRLGQLYPSLSKRELCYCGFICLGFSPESIRILYNHTNVYSIYTMRSKIRNKLGITNNSLNLETHILKMMEILKSESA